MTDASTSNRYYITTSIPYVNGTPHIGFSLEVIQCDALARFHRLIGDDTRYHTGTDDNSLTNLQAADKAGDADPGARRPQRRAVPRPSASRSTSPPMPSSAPAPIPCTSRAPRNCGARWPPPAISTPASTRGSTASGASASTSRKNWSTASARSTRRSRTTVDEVNYFFRLSAYGDKLRELIESNTLLVQPEHRREEMLSFIASGLEDISISRQALRGRGWGVPVPDDPDQVMYVWVDALSNYITALDYADDGPDYERYWVDNPNRVHVIGKDIIRFHVVYWPAFLLSADLPLPTRDQRPRVPDGRRRKDQQEQGQHGRSGRDRRPLRHSTPCATGCCAKCRARATATSPTSA